MAATKADRRILLIEDNLDDVELTIRAFKKNNLATNVVVVHDGSEALDYLFGNGEYEGRDVADLPQIILLDLKLKKVDGLEVLKRVRADHRTRMVPVIVLTSSQEEQDLIASYSLGANSYLRKPIDFKHFLEAVRQLGLYWLEFNVQPPAPEE